MSGSDRDGSGTDGPGAAHARALVAGRLRPAVLLDRDGVINTEVNYLWRIEDFSFVPGTPQALARLQAMGWLLVVVTNQSGMARGYYAEADYQALTTHMRQRLQHEAGVVLDLVLHCPHLPDAVVPQYRQACACRKPAPGMLLQAAKTLGLDLAASVMVGDKGSDLQAAQAAGVGRRVLVRSGHAPGPADLALAHEVHHSLADWVQAAAAGWPGFSAR